MVGATQVKGRGPGRGGHRTLRMPLWLFGAVAALLAAAPTVAEAAEPASKYDTSGQRHNDVCVKFRSGLSSIDLRYLSGLGTGFYLPTMLTGACPEPGQIRLDLHEIVHVPSTTPDPEGVLKDGLVFHRGGNGYDDAQNVRYGQLAKSELVDPSGQPLPDSVSDPYPPPGHNGAPCKRVQSTSYKVSVQPIPQEMKYKSPKAAGGSNAGASYLHYGDPAAQQGDQNLNEPPTSSPYPQKYSRSTTTIHYSTLTWSWIDVAGGGHNRILLAPAQDIRLCNVQPIDYPSWAPGSDPNSDGQVNGRVTARYVQTHVDDGPALYGWMVWSHQYYYDDSGNYIGPAAPVVNHFTTG
jgi:hypothetical protein